MVALMTKKKKTAKPARTRLNVILSPEAEEWLRGVAAEQGVSMSEALRAAVWMTKMLGPDVLPVILGGANLYPFGDHKHPAQAMVAQEALRLGEARLRRALSGTHPAGQNPVPGNGG